MHIVVYAKPDNRSRQRLNRALASVDLDPTMEFHEDVDRFCDRFRTIATHPDLIVIMPSGCMELECLLNVRDLFEDIRIIVILPEHGDVTITKGHKFRPSYMTFADDDFGEVAAILKHLDKSRCTSAPSLAVRH